MTLSISARVIVLVGPKLPSSYPDIMLFSESSSIACLYQLLSISSKAVA